MFKLTFLGIVEEHSEDGTLSIKLENNIQIKMFHSFPVGNGWCSGSISFEEKHLDANGTITGGGLFIQQILETQKSKYKYKPQDKSQESDAPKPKTKFKTREDRKKVVDLDLDEKDVPTANPNETTTETKGNVVEFN